ncbi:MAG: inositol monophosphatase family protein, partial [Candidatus Saccharibacteria bacterium]|nr:inositol monophosphatase family protein [Candidatus Saccharibacteria bacterium]
MDLTKSQNITPELINSMMEQIILCFRQVRPLVLERAGKSDFINKQDGSPVTATDSEVEEVIFKSIHDKFPSIPVFGEESGYDENLPEVCWLIDPIDGTAS